MYRILLVEDDAALADAITQVLTAWGHEVQKVRDFRHVTEEFAEWKPQIVLMDLMLPFFNGHHWTQELRRITSVPIVYLSSASDNLNIVMAMNMGGDDFIAKPVDPAVLAAKVNASCAARMTCRLRAISSPAGRPCWIWTVQPSPSMGRASP